MLAQRGLDRPADGAVADLMTAKAGRDRAQEVVAAVARNPCGGGRSCSSDRSQGASGTIVGTPRHARTY
jgi:hypothetical protein